MQNFLATLILLVSSNASGAQSPVIIPVEEWSPALYDEFLVDTKDNMGYLIHQNGSFTSFPIATGQRRTVSYIGRTYFAATPEREWIAKSDDIKGDRVTFGPRGLFIRLYDKYGKTSYGIHGHRDGEKMMTQDIRYESMGCVIVSEDILNLILWSYELNNKELRVTTSYGLDKLKTKVSLMY